MTSLTYKQVYDIAKDGDIIFFEGNKCNPIHWITMIATSSRYVHVGIVFWVTVGHTRRLMLVDANVNSKRRIVNFSMFENSQMSLVPAPLPWDAVCNSALAKVAQAKYSIWTAIYIGIREFLMTRLNVTLPMYDPPREVCSEFVAKVYGLTDTTISPQVLYDRLTTG